MKPGPKRPGRKKAVRKRAVARPAARTKRKRPAARPVAPPSPLAGIRVPPILLEGDDAPEPVEIPPAPAHLERFAPARVEVGAAGPALAPLEIPEISEPALAVMAAASKEPGADDLPRSYGTSRLTLSARDSRWLYAHWDMDPADMRRHNAASASGRLALRVHKGSLAAPAFLIIDLHSDSTHWFVPVDQAGTRYVADIGYNTPEGAWRSVAVSDATLTPPEAASEDRSARFTTIPPEIPLPRLLGWVKEAVAEHPSMAAALEELRRDGHPALPPAPVAAAPREWTPAQEKALARVISLDEARRIWMGSLEVTEVIRRQMKEEAPAGNVVAPAAAFGGVSSPTGISGMGLGAAAPTSPGAATPTGRKARKFWMSVNAELVIYGATEPDARVSIGPRKIKLRPDGTFSFRFILPDGEYELPVTAESADGEETREARLRFRRETERRGEVGAHPQDSRMGKPDGASAA